MADTYVENQPVTVDPNSGLINLGDLAGGTSYASGGGGGANPTQTFLREYQAVLVELYGRTNPTPAQKKLMDTCAKKQWPASVFLALLRTRDPYYTHSDDFQSRVREAWQLWKQYFPGRNFPNSLATAYGRSTKNLQWFDWKIRQTNAFKKLYPNLRLAEQRGSAAASPETYRAWRADLNQAYRMYLGRDATSLEQKLLFSSGISGEEIQTRLPEILGGVEAFRWATGAAPKPTDLTSAIFKQKGSAALLNRMATSKGTQASYLGSENLPFGLTVDESTGALVQPRI